MRTKEQNEKRGKPEIVKSSDNKIPGDAAKCLCDGLPEPKDIKGIVVIHYPLTSRLIKYLECPKPCPIKPTVKTNSTNENTVLSLLPMLLESMLRLMTGFHSLSYQGHPH